MASTLYPLFLDLAERLVVVVGGGTVAARKVAGLLPCGARVRVVAPRLGAELAAHLAAQRIEHRQAWFCPADLDGALLAIAATGLPEVNAAVAAAGAQRAMVVNVVDDPLLGNCQVPARIERGPLCIAISSGGRAPVLARLLRARLESLLDPALGRLADLLDGLREAIRARLPDLLGRRRWYESLLQDALLDPSASVPELAAARLLASAEAHARGEGRRGRVTLVGAGPGAAGLLTLAGLRALQSADVLLHDRLVSTEVLDLARRDAERIAVGKCARGPSVSQAEIHRLMLEHAAAGRHVVRLKGGDPFIFGRGGEELEFLRLHGIDYQVVPGITAALACAAHAGIPLTHREHAQSLRLLTAHCADSIDTLDWAALAQERQTLAVYMGVAALPRLRQGLLQRGRDPSTPVALIEDGSRSSQRVLLGSLERLPELAQAHQLRSPSLLIVGPVAALAKRLHWFGAAPLELPEIQALSRRRRLPGRGSRSPRVAARSACRSTGIAADTAAPGAPVRG